MQCPNCKEENQPGELKLVEVCTHYHTIDIEDGVLTDNVDESGEGAPTGEEYLECDHCFSQYRVTTEPRGGKTYVTLGEPIVA